MSDSIDHELLEALAKAEDEARRSIGRELRDSTAQHLVAISFGLHNLEFIAQQKFNIQAAIANSRASIDAAGQEIRIFAYLLNPPEGREVHPIPALTDHNGRGSPPAPRDSEQSREP